ncbi:MAG TPA: hypothetical protein DET40_18170, partial [Lentisphaeria bacterium]|nr:hypothetical protein [Lentisphaeria bacterium]
AWTAGTPAGHRWRCGKDNEDCQQECWRSGRWNTAWTAGTLAGIGGDVEKTMKTASRSALAVRQMEHSQ